MAIKLIKACKELNIGMSAAVEFLAKQGMEINTDPNLRIEDDLYMMLAQEFNPDMALKMEAERQQQQQQEHNIQKSAAAAKKAAEEEARKAQEEAERAAAAAAKRAAEEEARKAEEEVARLAAEREAEEQARHEAEPAAQKAAQEVSEKDAKQAAEAQQEPKSQEPKKTEIFTLGKPVLKNQPKVVGKIELNQSMRTTRENVKENVKPINHITAEQTESEETKLKTEKEQQMHAKIAKATKILQAKNAKVKQETKDVRVTQKTKLNSYLEKWTCSPECNNAIKRLKELALKEKWYYGKTPNQGSYPILRNYLIYTVKRLVYKDKIKDKDKYAAFNTGLVDKHYEPIYALFEKNMPNNNQLWGFVDFCIKGVKGETSAGKILTRFFNPLPEKAEYFETLDDVIYDEKCEIHPDYTHIIKDHPERLPTKGFLDRWMPDFVFEDWRKMKQDQVIEYSLKLRKAIDDSIESKIHTALKDAIEIARKRAGWNYRTAIPSYYPRTNSSSLLLPLSLLEESIENNKADVALVIQKQESGNYEGHTIIPLDWAYSNARLVTRPDSDWLVAEKIDAPDDRVEENE